MAISEYLQAGYKKAWTERKTVTWAALALLSRLAPLSAMPLMLEFSTIGDADRYALILTNASILSIVLNFGQVSNMQARFSGSGFSSIAIQGICTAFAIALPLTLIGMLVLEDFSTVAINIIFSIAMALTAQYNALLRCSNNFSTAIFAELLRVAMFVFAVITAINYERLGLLTMTIIMIVYYITPYVIMLSGVRSSFVTVKAAIHESWTDRSRLLYWTLSAGLSAGAWVAIRYMVALFGGEGDLARFSAIMSICSGGVILADLVYVRLSRAIVSSIEEGRTKRIIRMIKGVIPVSMSGFLLTFIASSSYIYVALGADTKLIVLALFLSSGYAVRFLYVFGQQILIARGLANYDLAGGIAMMLVALSASWILVPEAGVVGAGVTFFLTAATMLTVVSWGVRRHWRVS